MIVFIRSEEMAKNNPQILASYGDDSDVNGGSHGTGVQMFKVPPDAIHAHEVGGVRTLILAGDWRERSARTKTFTVRERLDLIHELVRLMIKNGTDVTTWPSSDRDREIAIQRKWDLSP